jgi:cAMP-dependent protein kinase regulator
VVPPGFPELLKDLNREVLRAQPSDIYSFCANYFSRKLKERGTSGAKEEVEKEASPPASDADMDDDDEEYAPPTPPPPSSVNRGRRTSVSAESMVPTVDKDYEKVVIPKSEEQKKRIEASIRQNFLFRSLDDEQYVDVVNAMAEKKVVAGEVVIQQGGIGDYFYVVEEGAFDVFVAKGGNPPVKVTEYGNGGSFGELALMYNAPRAATVTATKDSTIWALDRVTFRRILMEITSRKLKMYESFLEEVPLLMSLEPYERHKIADALEPVTFADGEVLMRQGDDGENFYIIESGNAVVSQLDSDGIEHKMHELKKGDYCGELALLLDQPRKATITAKGKLKCATLGKKAFVRLLGPVVDIIKRNAANYEQIHQKINLE